MGLFDISTIIIFTKLDNVIARQYDARHIHSSVVIILRFINNDCKNIDVFLGT
jgi:hypothetical protein